MSSTLAPVPPAAKKAPTKKRRPTFRPARKTSAKATRATAAAPAHDVVPPPAPESNAAGSLEINDDNEQETASSLRSSAPKRSSKKRKVVSIGSSRPEEPTGPEDTTEPAVPSEPQIPDADPGKPKLQAYCGRYRFPKKEKRRATQKAPKVPVNQENEPADQTKATAGPVVQVVNGEIVLQESSMVVPGARRSVEEVEEEFEQVVEEEAHSAVVGASYNSFVSRRAPQHWSVAETKKFYNALRQVGPDFATMSAYFDDRTRKQLKRKYQIENSKNPHLIELALSPQAQVPLDLSVFNVEVAPADKNATTAVTLGSTTTASNTTPPSQSETLQNNQNGAREESSMQPEGVTLEPSDKQTDSLEIPNGEVPVEELYPEEVSFFAEDTIDTVTAQSGQTVSTIPLAPTQPKAKAKRPKFKATRSKAKGKS